MGSGANVIRERKKVMREGEGGLRKWLNSIHFKKNGLLRIDPDVICTLKEKI